MREENARLVDEQHVGVPPPGMHRFLLITVVRVDNC
jgi:hypothetical protein